MTPVELDNIPDTIEEIDAEIRQLLEVTPESSERGRLFHLLDAARKLGGGGGSGIPLTEPTTQLTIETAYSEILSGDTVAYQIDPAGLFPVNSELWSNTAVQAALIKSINNNDSTGVIGAKLTATDLEVHLEYMRIYDSNLFTKSYSITKSAGHDGLWMGTTTFKDDARGNIIITGKTLTITSLELSLYRLNGDNLVKIGDTTLDINTNNDIDEIRVNAIPYGSDKILIAVNCDLYDHRQTAVFFVSESDTTTKTFIIPRTDHTRSVRPLIYDFTNETTSSTTHYLGIVNMDGMVDLWQDLNGTVTKTGLLEDRNGLSYSSKDAIMSVHTSMNSGTTILYSNRSVFEGDTELPLTILDDYNNTITPLNIALNGAMRSKYNITSAMLYTIPWTSTPGIEALLLLEPKEGSGLHIFDILPDGSLVFSGYVSATSIEARGYTFYGENLRGIIPASATSIPDNYATLLPEYADDTRSNKDALIANDPNNVREVLKYDTQENVLGAVGIYDANPITAIDYIDHGNFLQLPPKNAVLKVYPDTTLLIPKAAAAGTQWTIHMQDPDGRAGSAVKAGLGCPILAEPLEYADPKRDPAYLAVGIAEISNPDARTMGVVHVVKVSDTEFKVVPLQ
ncbi:hypothetical protein [Vibrio phage vB_ValS_PJ32]|nr:hypothetical protein [Vibrio phage vB_ValS_PJ32]